MNIGNNSIHRFLIWPFRVLSMSVESKFVIFNPHFAVQLKNNWKPQKLAYFVFFFFLWRSPLNVFIFCYTDPLPLLTLYGCSDCLPLLTCLWPWPLTPGSERGWTRSSSAPRTGRGSGYWPQWPRGGESCRKDPSRVQRLQSEERGQGYEGRILG